MGSRSIIRPGSSNSVPAGRWPGHEAMLGTRIPPSNTEPFDPRKPPAEPPV